MAVPALSHLSLFSEHGQNFVFCPDKFSLGKTVEQGLTQADIKKMQGRLPVLGSGPGIKCCVAHPSHQTSERKVCLNQRAALHIHQMLHPVIKHCGRYILGYLPDLLIQRIRMGRKVPDRFNTDTGGAEIRFIKIQRICAALSDLTEIRTPDRKITWPEPTETAPDYFTDHIRIRITDNDQNHIFRPVPGIIILPEQS